jgi:hypothetical protein
VLVPVFTVSPLAQEPLFPPEDGVLVPLLLPLPLVLVLVALLVLPLLVLLLLLAVPGREQAIKNMLPRANAARSSASVRKCFLAIIQKPLKWYGVKYASSPPDVWNRPFHPPSYTYYKVLCKDL